MNSLSELTKHTPKNVEARIEEIHAGVADWIMVNTQRVEAGHVAVALLRMGIGCLMDWADVETVRGIVDEQIKRAVERHENGFTMLRRRQ